MVRIRRRMEDVTTFIVKRVEGLTILQAGRLLFVESF